MGYYRRFVKRFSDKAAALDKLLHKDHPWEWTPQCQNAFEQLKAEIVAKPVSAYPDFSKPFRVYTDASNIGLGAILAQNQEGKEKIICCASRTLNQAEVNYSATKKECLVVVWGINTFRPFLIATKFKGSDRSLFLAVVKVDEERIGSAPSMGGFPRRLSIHCTTPARETARPCGWSE